MKCVLRNYLAAAACVGAILAVVAPVHAAGLTLVERGKTMGVYTGISSDGLPMCSISPLVPDERSFFIKWFLGQPGYIVHVFKDSWRIPEGTRITVNVGFDDNGLGTAQATGHATPAGTGYLQFGINGDMSKQFWTAFRSANQMWMTFPDGTEQPWSTTTMADSNFIADAFGRCMSSVVNAKRPNATQPYGGAPTQPYAAKPPAEPTQPFASGPKRVPTNKYPTQRGDSI